MLAIVSRLISSTVGIGYPCLRRSNLTELRVDGADLTGHCRRKVRGHRFQVVERVRVGEPLHLGAYPLGHRLGLEVATFVGVGKLWKVQRTRLCHYNPYVGCPVEIPP